MAGAAVTAARCAMIATLVLLLALRSALYGHADLLLKNLAFGCRALSSAAATVVPGSPPWTGSSGRLSGGSWVGRDREALVFVKPETVNR